MVKHRCLAPALSFMLVVLLAALMPVRAWGASGTDSAAITKWDDLDGARVAMLIGAPFEEAVRAKCPTIGEVLYFATLPDMIAATNAGKVDAFVTNEAVGMLAANRNDNLKVFPEPLNEAEMGIAFPKGSALTEQFAAITERMRQDGTADALWEKWTSADDSEKTVPEQDWPGTNGTLKVAACATLEPVSYLAEGQMLGYDIETLLLAAKELDVHVDFEPLEFAEVLAFLQSGKADIGCGSILVTEERKQGMDFAVTHDNNLVLLVRDTSASAETAAGDATGDLELKTVDEVLQGRLGVVSGGAFDTQMMNNFDTLDNSSFSYYNSTAELVGALKANKIDAFFTDMPIAKLAVSRNSGIGMLPQTLLDDNYGMALQKGSPLTPRFNEVIERLVADGTADEIYQRWTGDDEDAKVIPEQDWEAPNGTLVVALNAEVEPSAYIKDGREAGLAVEILYCIARELGYHVEIKEVSIPALIAEVQSGKADVGVSCLSITEERKKVVDMTVPYCHGGVVAVVRLSADAAAADSASTGILASFERTFITESRWKLILSGLLTTLAITLCSSALGTALGFASVLLRRRGNRAATLFVSAFEGLMGRLPIVVVLMVFYYVVFGSLDIPGLLVAILVFALAFGASSGSIMWNAVQAVDVGQSEASLALGFTDSATFFGVVLPQAARRFLPLLSGQLVSLAKDTSVVGYIAVQDLTRAGDLIRSRTMEAFFPLISTAVIYFALCCLLAAGMNVIIRRLDIERRPRAIKGVEL